MIPGIFVTGTGTDVGKTVVTAGVLRLLRRHGEAAMAMKPVQTGCGGVPGKPAVGLAGAEEADSQGRMRAPDIDFVLRAAGLTGDVDEETRTHLAPYCFAPACSPHLAARMAGLRIELDRILASAQWLAARYRRLVVEGAGGLMVPLNESQSMLDLAWSLHMPVLLVGHSGLGTINHVLLSLEALRRRGCAVLGVVLNDTHPVEARDRYIHEDNVHAIKSFGKTNVTRIPFLRAAPGASLNMKPLNMEALDASLEQCGFLREHRAGVAGI